MKHKSKKIIFNIICLIIVAIGLYWISSKFINLGDVEKTDNAQVKQLITPVNSRAQGYISEIKFDEYQAVKKGDTLVVIENSEYKLRLAQAEADLQNAIAGKSIVNAAVETVGNNVAVTEAGIAEVKALLDNAAVDYKRYENLLAQQSVTPQEFDRVKTNYIALKAKYETLSRQKQTTVLAKNETSTRIQSNEATIKLAQAAVELAKLNLSYTTIIAPADGFVGRKNLQIGQLIQPGQPIVDIIDSNERWVIANYKETQTQHIIEGQNVEITVDAMPNVIFKGVVKSIANATGSSFSVIPQDNSAGNFVKVEQRIPVRIEFSKENDANLLQKLRAGMNVECSIKYK